MMGAHCRLVGKDTVSYQDGPGTAMLSLANVSVAHGVSSPFTLQSVAVWTTNYHLDYKPCRRQRRVLLYKELVVRRLSVLMGSFVLTPEAYPCEKTLPPMKQLFLILTTLWTLLP